MSGPETNTHPVGQRSARHCHSPWLRARLAAVLAASLLAGCSTTGLLDALQPREALRVTRDPRYAPGARGTLDVYAPRSSTGNAAVVQFIRAHALPEGALAQSPQYWP